MRLQLRKKRFLDAFTAERTTEQISKQGETARTSHYLVIGITCNVALFFDRLTGISLTNVRNNKLKGTLKSKYRKKILLLQSDLFMMHHNFSFA